MPPSRTFFGRTTRTQRRYSSRLRAVAVAAASIVIFFITTSAIARGQEPFPSAPTQTGDQSTSSDTSGAAAAQDNSSGSSGDSGSTLPNSQNSVGLTAPTLSADQIISILQQHPDLVVELKSLMADRLQEQGTQIDQNDISDEAFYDQIAASPSLRASVATYLRARGYLTEEDLGSAEPGATTGLTTGVTGNMGSSAALGGSQLPPGATFPLGATSGAALGAQGGLAGGQLPTQGNGLTAPMGQSMSPAGSRQQTRESRANEDVHASTDVPKVLREPAPYNLLSMRDLYTQIPDQSARLKRFGSDVFVNRNVSAAMRGMSGRDTPLDVPLGPDYVVGAGDTLLIEMSGGGTTTISRVVDRDGRILLPEAGPLAVAGLSLARVQDLIESALKREFRNAQAVVTVSHLRSVRVYVVGDVQRPGGYDISALATPVSALYAAGGPTSVGSLRTLRHYRGQQLVEDIDLYDFLLHGVRNGSAHFESGDTLLVPPAGPQVAVFGAIKRPAIYELKGSETTLDSVIDDAGGFTAAASLGHITIDRIDDNRQRETVTLKVAGDQGPQADRDAIKAFQVKDGDRIRVEPILPYSERAIYLEGHVVRPGRRPYTEGMRLSDVLHSYRDLLPEPAAHGEIVRLVAPDLHAETIDFDVPDVLIGNANVSLEPFDTVRILGRYEADAPKVTIRGEVLRPSTYPLSKGMTAAQLVRMAGGFKRDALREAADLTSYQVNDGNRIVENLTSVRIGVAVAGTDPNADVPLKPGDILAIHQITGWTDIGESITIEGQVRFPGSYGFKDGERLSAVLRRAGGFLPAAYPTGAVLVREQVRQLEQQSREELIRQIETNSAAARLAPNLGGGDAGATAQLIKAQQEQAISDLKNHPPNGRMVIHITADIDSWANTPADIELRRGDVLTVPKVPGFVLVTGQVYNATALTFAPGKTAGWYLSHAGGTNSTANRKEIFIIRANGSVIGRRSGGFFDSDVLSIRLNPGDVVVVPQKIIGSSLFWRNLLATAQLASSIAITAGIANL
jgi:protein involved in polysaccharide export with SLBB domain